MAKVKRPHLEQADLEKLVNGLGSVEARATYLSQLYSERRTQMPHVSDVYVGRLVDACASKGRYDLAARLVKDMAASASSERTIKSAFRSVELFSRARDVNGVLGALSFLAEMFGEVYEDVSDACDLPHYQGVSKANKELAIRAMGYAEIAGSLDYAREFAAIAGVPQKVTLYERLLEIQKNSKK